MFVSVAHHGPFTYTSARAPLQQPYDGCLYKYVRLVGRLVGRSVGHSEDGWIEV